jgi:putative transposase
MRKQSILLGVARSTITYKPVTEDPQDHRINRTWDEIYLKDPCLGSRRLVTVLERDHGIKANRKRLPLLGTRQTLDQTHGLPLPREKEIF